jgi:hypothetical protein
MVLASAGLHLGEYYGALAEAAWSPGSGLHRFKIAGGYLRPARGPALESYTGSYRAFIWPLDLAIELTGGQFLYEDRGFSVELRRWFGSTSLGFFYARTTTQLAGIRLSLPLTPRKDMRPGWLQVRGTERFRYQHATVVGQNSNPIESLGLLAVTPEVSQSLDRVYFNADRLAAGHIKRHLPRLHDAYWTLAPLTR